MLSSRLELLFTCLLPGVDPDSEAVRAAMGAMKDEKKEDKKKDEEKK